MIYRKIALAFLMISPALAIAQSKKLDKPAPKKVTATPKVSTLQLKTENDSLSYAFGITIAEFLKSQDVHHVNGELLAKAVEQSLQNQPALLTANDANMIIQTLSQKQMMKKSAAEKAAGEKFLADNAKKPNIHVTASGLQYEILKDANGAKPGPDDTVSVHYKGSLLNGFEFDNSYKRGQPLEIPVKGVISGWVEALQMMPVGSKWKLYIPASLGYGDFGAGANIPGGATLIFEVELLGIK